MGAERTLQRRAGESGPAADRAGAVAELRATQARLQALDHPFPGGWNANAPYWPSALPGLLGDLDGVRAAEQDYLENSPRDVWAGLDIRLDLAIAFAPAGDPQRALEHLGAVAAIAGPASYLRFSIQPGLDSLHEQPRRYRDMYPSAFRPTAPSICC